jgi:hypothetical protein
MTDTASAAPVAGWYDDPSGAAPYRWWDGQHWTPQTIDHAPTAAPPAIAIDRPADSRPDAAAAAVPDSAFPSRRTLRHASGDVPLVSAGPSATRASPPGAQEPTPGAYTPVNPLLPVHAAGPGVLTPAPLPAEPAGAAGFHAPSAWVQNAPAAPLPPVMPYGMRGAPGGYANPYAPRADQPHPKNRPARWALTLPLLSLVLSPVVAAISRSGFTGFAISEILSFGLLGALIASIPLGIWGLLQANTVERQGGRPRGRPHAIIGIVLGVMILVFGIIAAVGVIQARTTTATGSSPSVTAPVQPVQTPEAGTPQDANGQTEYVYSESLAESQIRQAIVTKTHLTPTSVTCPASEPIVIGTTFDCTVTLPTGPLTAHITIVSDEGELEISSVD